MNWEEEKFDFTGRVDRLKILKIRIEKLKAMFNKEMKLFLEDDMKARGQKRN